METTTYQLKGIHCVCDGCIEKLITVLSEFGIHGKIEDLKKKQFQVQGTLDTTKFVNRLQKKFKKANVEKIGQQQQQRQGAQPQPQPQQEKNNDNSKEEKPAVPVLCTELGQPSACNGNFYVPPHVVEPSPFSDENPNACTIM